MSAGGQRGIDVSGITSLRIQNASDFTTRVRFQEFYRDSNQVGRNGFRNNDYFNSDQYYRQFLNGTKESCAVCTGLPYTIFK